MTSESANSNSGMQRTRRNIMKMGAIAIPAVLGTVGFAAASPPSDSGNPHVDGGSGNPHVDGGSGNPHVGSSCFLKGTKILTAEGERKIEDLASGICCRHCSAECVLSNGSAAIRSRRAIRPRRG